MNKLLLEPALKPLLFAVFLLPLAWLLYGALANKLGANPAEALIRATGDWTLRFLCLTLAITPDEQQAAEKIGALVASLVRDGDTIYVPLMKSGNFWVAINGITKTLPDSSKTAYIYIKGVIQNGGQEATPFSENNFNNWNNQSNITLKYNIESYFVPQGLGSTWVGARCSSWSQGRCMDAGDIGTYAVVSVGESGDGVLKQLYQNSKPWPK